jgi:hypothetical protein
LLEAPVIDLAFEQKRRKEVLIFPRQAADAACRALLFETADAE